MNELIKFYQSLMQEVIAMQSGDEDGDTQEQVFTRICLLSEKDYKSMIANLKEVNKDEIEESIFSGSIIIYDLKIIII